MISKLFTITFAVVASLVSAQLPEQFPAGVDPAKCPNFPICDNAYLHNSQAVPRTFSSEPAAVGGEGQHYYHQQQQPQQQHQHQPQNHYQSPQQQYSPPPSPPKHQWVSAEPQQHQSVPVSHRNTVLPSSSFGPVPAPAHVPGSYQPIQHHSSQSSSGGHESNSQWTLKNLRFDSGDYYQAPQSNHLPEPNHYNPPQQQPQQQQQSQHQFQYQHQYQPQPQQQHQQQYQQQSQHQQQQQQQHYVPEQNNRNYSPESDSSSHNVGKTPPGGDKYPAGVDASTCPNYPYCGATPTGQEGPGHAASAPLPGFTERLYPAGVNPQQCANFPYCFEQ